MLDNSQSNRQQCVESRDQAAQPNPLNELTVPARSSSLSRALHALCFLGLFFAAGDRLKGQQEEQPQGPSGGAQKPPPSGRVSPDGMKQTKEDGGKAQPQNAENRPAEPVKPGSAERDRAEAKVAEIEKLLAPLLSGKDYEGLSETQAAGRRRAILKIFLETLPKTAEYEVVRAAVQKKFSEPKTNLGGENAAEAVNPTPQAAVRLAGPSSIPMFEWTPGNLYDGKGQYRRMVYAKVPYHLSQGDALQGLIIAVQKLKGAHNGSIPAGYQVQVGRVVNGFTDTKKATVPLDQLPSSVTPQSLEVFKRSSGQAALGIISGNALPVLFSSNGARGLHMTILQTSGREGRNHWFVELTPEKKASR